MEVLFQKKVFVFNLLLISRYLFLTIFSSFTFLFIILIMCVQATFWNNLILVH